MPTGAEPQLTDSGDLAKVAQLDVERLKRDVKARGGDVKGLLARRTPQARQMLRKLLVDRLQFEHPPPHFSASRCARWTVQCAQFGVQRSQDRARSVP